MDSPTLDMDSTLQPLRWGAESRADGQTRFRLWAPGVERLGLELRDDTSQPVRQSEGWRELQTDAPAESRPALPMQRQDGGWWELVTQAPPGTRYRFVLPEGLKVPDPASRRQDGGVHGWSVVVGPDDYQWKNTGWRGRSWNEAVIYEAHAGLMGGFDGVRQQLAELRDLGVTAVEIMPVAEFPGDRSWGYDGTLNYAADSAYGTPEDLKRLIDEAHSLGLCVMLDVVYNHFGPDGNYIGAYCKPFFTEDMHTPWGAAIDFRKSEVMDFFVGNALMWLNEFRFDGLRFDALHAVMPQEVLAPLEHGIRSGVDSQRTTWLVMEHEDNAARFLRHGPGAPGFDAQWADDFHHCMHVLLTGETDRYYVDYDHPTERLARILAEGFAYQGEQSQLRGRPRGEPSKGLPTSCFVMHLQNHDQVGNRARGERLPALTSKEKLRAATALLLLSPFIPLVFMGDEWASESPFLYFTDHNEELADLVRKGRAKEFGIGVAEDPAEAEQKGAIPDPNAPETFEASRVKQTDPAMRDLYRQLLSLRRERIAPGIPGTEPLGCEVLGEGAVCARWRLGNGAELSLLLNIGQGDVSAQQPAGTLLHESLPGASEALRGGKLPPAALVAFLTDGRR
jgi:maltooligosyltrehalose trehalohydrolase